MEALLLGIYCFFVWLIFIKFKLLPWTTPWKVTVAIIPVVGLTAMILALNVVAPSSNDVRVFKYVVQIIPQVRGRVIEVPVEPNRLVKKGELLFRIDPTQYQNELNVAKAKLAADEAKLNQASANVVDVSASSRQLQEQLKSATSQVRSLQPRLDLARLRVRQYRELVATGAGDRFSLEQAEANLIDLQNQLATATANEAQVAQKLSGQVNGEQASVAGAKAQFATAKAQVDSSRADVANAQWNLDQTVMYAPTSGHAINVQLRPGSYVVAAPFAPAMTFVEEDYQVVALYQQNELLWVQPGDEAEFALNTMPGRIIKAKVDSIVWAQGQGQVQGQITQGNALPQTGMYPSAPGRFPVKFTVEDKDPNLFLAAGAAGHGAIYTQHGEIIHLVRKVIVRVGAITDFLVLKLH
jgi:multidrug resistance efflux pump